MCRILAPVGTRAFTLLSLSVQRDLLIVNRRQYDVGVEPGTAGSLFGTAGVIPALREVLLALQGVVLSLRRIVSSVLNLVVRCADALVPGAERPYTPGSGFLRRLCYFTAASECFSRRYSGRARLRGVFLRRMCHFTPEPDCFSPRPTAQCGCAGRRSFPYGPRSHLRHGKTSVLIELPTQRHSWVGP